MNYTFIAPTGNAFSIPLNDFSVKHKDITVFPLDGTKYLTCVKYIILHIC